MRFYKLFIVLLLTLGTVVELQASKLVYVKVVDKDMLMLYYKDGDAYFNETPPYTSGPDANSQGINYYGSLLNTGNATTNSNYSIKSTADANFGAGGVSPTTIYRRSKICGMSQENWNTGTNDYNYDYAFEHSIFVQLPSSLVQGNEYTIDIAANTNTDVTSYTFTYDIFNTKSESIKVNVVGYDESSAVKAADLYMWLGDGGQRDFSALEGNKVYVYDVNTMTPTEVGTVQFWKNEAPETTHGHHPIQSDVWNIDFTGFTTPGTYRLVVEGVGCSDEFEIKSDVYYEPFKVSTQGFYYMRIGAKHETMTPLPRTPYYLPNNDPANCKVYITTMHPFHAQWGTFSSGDPYDQEQDWAAYSTGRESQAWGGHSDAKDWDRYLGHSMSIYDMLLPYILTNGAIGDDDLGIYESGNGVPDVIDEAKDEVDLWLRVRDGKGYGNGLTNATDQNVLYQTANTGVAAWCNAFNAAMLSNAYMISGHTSLMQEYRDSAINAFTYANSLSTADQMLDEVERGGMRGRDFRVSAAAFLYNVTGDTQWEDILASECIVTNGTTSLHDAGTGGTYNQLYATAAYLFTPQVVNYQTLWNNMKSSVIAEAKSKEANYSLTRPSRRSSDNTGGWFQTEMAVQRTIIAHAIADDGADKDLLLDALLLEADWTLGRNPLNMIQMTTATTNLESERSVENAYTSGWNDGTPGVHPGHTPYMNVSDWGGTMVMGNPTMMFSQSYPATIANWPFAEQYINTRFVYAHCEFTPQQTMRCKQALYGYLYGLGPSCDKPNLGPDVSICGVSSIDLDANIAATGRTFSWTKDGADIPTAKSNTLNVTEAGTYKVTTDEGGCVKSDQINILDVLPSVDLGGDVEICDPASQDITISVTGTGISYSWKKDGTLIGGATLATYTATEAGTYTGIISATGCPDKTDDIVVTSGLLNVTSGEICAAGPLTLIVNESGGTYEWYDDPIAGNLVHTGDSYTPTISSSTTYYVEDVSGMTGSLGKVATDGGDTWSMGAAYFAETDKMAKITVSQTVTLESVDVYVEANGTDVTINVVGATTHSATVTGLNSGKQTINLGFSLTPGTYTMDLDGTTGSISYEASAAAFPYEYPAYISFENNVGWASGWYGYFYDWKISSGNPCSRTPIEAVINPAGVGCISGTTQTISLIEGWNFISINVNPSVKTIESIFAGVNIEKVKNAYGFWKAGQDAEFNSVTAISPGYGYLVYSNEATTFTVTGTQIAVDYSDIKTGWQYIGCQPQSTSSFDTYFNTIDVEVVKDFEGFWEPSGTLNSIQNIEPGKGYFLKGK